MMNSYGRDMLGSNISHDTIQSRYQKAIRQINKLIEINRQQKDVLSRHQQQVLAMSQHISQLHEHSNQLQRQIKVLQQEGKELRQENNMMGMQEMEYQATIKELKQERDGLRQQKDALRAQMDEQQRVRQLMGARMQEQSQNAREIQARYHQREQEVNRLQQLISQQETEQRKRQEGYVEVQHTLRGALQSLTVQLQQSQLNSGAKSNQQRIEYLQQKLQQSQSQLQKSQKQLNLCRQKLQTTQKQLLNNQKQLQSSQSQIQRLKKQCSSLQGKQIQIEASEQRKQVRQMIGIKPLNSQSEDVISLISQYKKRIKALQQQKCQLEKRHKQVKLQIMSNNQRQGLLKKIEGLQKLTQKQQMQMSALIDTYDRQVHRLHKQQQKLKNNHQKELKASQQKTLKASQQQSQLSLIKHLQQLKAKDHLISQLQHQNSTLINQHTDTRLQQLTQRTKTQSSFYSPLSDNKLSQPNLARNWTKKERSAQVSKESQEMYPLHFRNSGPRRQ